MGLIAPEGTLEKWWLTRAGRDACRIPLAMDVEVDWVTVETGVGAAV